MTLHSRSCPYCLNIPGVGSQRLKSPRRMFDQLLGVGPGVVVTPTVGMLMPGYFLVVANEHLLSFAEYSAAQLDDLQVFLAARTEELAAIFGDYIIFEHGPSAKEAASQGSCISHAHLHLIPAANKAGTPLRSSLTWEPLSRLSDLKKLDGAPYALFAINGQFYISEDSTPAPQWIRKKVVEWLNLNVDWNWATYAGEHELKATFEALLRSEVSRMK